MPLSFCFLLLFLLYPGSWQGYCATIHVVDVERILATSRAALAGQKHVREARRILENGFDELRRLYDESPEEERQKILNEGASALIRQLDIEQQAVNATVSEMMLETIREWRQANNADLVIARQNLLDASNAADITDAIIQAMDAKTPRFGDLPVVNIMPPDETPPKAPGK